VTTFETIAKVRAAVRDARGQGKTVGVVPTMGALHAGHGELIRRARAETDYVIVTIFVNPIQFDRQEDLDRYPRDLIADLALCEQTGADAVFAPSAEEMYPEKLLTSVDVAELASKLEGEFRPGHFKGVTTVVAKLLNIAAADRAYFGEKDFQQLTLVRKMVADLNIPTEIVPVATVREPDGLALSSRNRLLAPQDRAVAPAFHQALLRVRDRLSAGDPAADARSAGLAVINGVAGMRVEYLEIDGDRILGAVWLSGVRLIDNVAIS
jgi:pantoate--beta-alanine ligase